MGRMAKLGGKDMDDNFRFPGILEQGDYPGDADNANIQDNPHFEPIGTTGLYRFANFIYEEFLPQLRWPQAAAVYLEMSENDATIGSILYVTEQLVRKSTWRVDPASSDEIDKKNADFVNECMHDMSLSWEDTISEILSMFVYGWSFHEVIYKYRIGPQEKNNMYRSKYTDGRIGWRDLPIRSQQTLYGWRFADDGPAVAMIQWAPPHYIMTEIPFSKGLLFRTKILRNNPQGKSLLRNAYRSWYFKKRIEEIEGIGIERDLAGLPVLQPPETIANIWDKTNPQARDLLSQAEHLVRNIRMDKSQGVVIPYGWDLKLLSTGGKRQFDTNSIINRYDQRIAITMLADLVLLGSEKVGSFALGEVKKSLMANAIEALIQSIADVFNKQAIPTLMEINHFDCKNGYPKIIPDEIEAPSLEDVARIFKATGLKLDADIELYNYVRKLLQVKPISKKDFDELIQRQMELEEAKTPQYNFGEKKGTKVNTQEGAVQNPESENGERGYGRSTEGDTFSL